MCAFIILSGRAINWKNEIERSYIFSSAVLSAYPPSAENRRNSLRKFLSLTHFYCLQASPMRLIAISEGFDGFRGYFRKFDLFEELVCVLVMTLAPPLPTSPEYLRLRRPRKAVGDTRSTRGVYPAPNLFWCGARSGNNIIKLERRVIEFSHEISEENPESVA
jgi:hypothetical protein